MWKIGLATLLLAVCSLAIGCANRLPASALAPRLQYQGFSSARPPNDNWYVNRNEQDHTTLLFRREVSGNTHSFFFAVQLNKLEREPRSNEDFAELVRGHMVAVTDPQRHEVLSYHSEPEPRQGQFCVRYSLQTLDRKSPVLPGRELSMNFEGLACRHPLWPNAILDAYYSERGVAHELDSTLHSEGEQLLQGLTIEVQPGLPAA
jgi:hypothetical protein